MAYFADTVQREGKSFCYAARCFLKIAAEQGFSVADSWDLFADFCSLHGGQQKPMTGRYTDIGDYPLASNRRPYRRPPDELPFEDPPDYMTDEPEEIPI